jgi:quinol monooxygenase YgiN
LGTLSTEPLACSYTWGESTITPNEFHFQEVYKSEDGFKAHTKTTHFAAWEKFANDINSPFALPPEVNTFTES